MNNKDVPVLLLTGYHGSGKTTLTKMLAKRYNWSPRFEPVEHNPYLDDFYRDMSRWSFNLQIYFLNKRFNPNRSLENFAFILS